MTGSDALLAGDRNVVQGLSGVCTLTIGSLVADAPIFAGVALGMKRLEQQT
jgi:hypothetical protein